MALVASGQAQLLHSAGCLCYYLYREHAALNPTAVSPYWRKRMALDSLSLEVFLLIRLGAVMLSELSMMFVDLIQQIVH